MSAHVSCTENEPLQTLAS